MSYQTEDIKRSEWKRFNKIRLEVKRGFFLTVVDQEFLVDLVDRMSAEVAREQVIGYLQQEVTT